MALTTVQNLRFRISDNPRRGDETFYGDGVLDTFQLSHWPIVTASAAAAGSPTGFVKLPAPTGWSATGCTFDLRAGTVQFSGIVTASTAVRAVYKWAAFSDEEIDEITGLHPSDSNGQVLEAIKVLMGDAYKRVNWAAAGGQSVSEGQIMDNLRKWRETIVGEQRGPEVGPVGGIEAWSEQQENYGEPYSQ